MALVRRRIRKLLLARYGLSAERVRSHVSGAISITAPVGGGRAFNAADQDAWIRELLDEVRSWGFEPVEVRQGTTGGGRFWYVTFTTQAMAEEAASRYGDHRMRMFLSGVEGGRVEEAEQVVAELEEDGEFELPEVQMEALEASEV